MAEPDAGYPGAYTVFSEWQNAYGRDNTAKLGDCANCGKPYGEHLEIKGEFKDDPYKREMVRAVCHQVFFLREKRKTRDDEGGRRRSKRGKHE